MSIGERWTLLEILVGGCSGVGENDMTRDLLAAQAITRAEQLQKAQECLRRKSLDFNFYVFCSAVVF